MLNIVSFSTVSYHDMHSERKINLTRLRGATSIQRYIKRESIQNIIISMICHAGKLNFYRIYRNTQLQKSLTFMRKHYSFCAKFDSAPLMAGIRDLR